MNRQQTLGTTVIFLVLAGVWASSREPAPPPAPTVAAKDVLPMAAAEITTVTLQPSPTATVTASPTIIVITSTETVVFVPPAPTEVIVFEPPAPTSEPEVEQFVPAATDPPAPPPPPPPTAYVPPPPPPSDPSVAGAEQGLIDQVNYERSLVGLAAFARDETLMQIARGRAADMLARGYFGHTDPGTGAFLARDQIMGAGYSRAGENILRSHSGLPDLPANAIGWFMGDAPHRDNLLHPAYSVIGAGVVADGSAWIVVLVFAN